MIHFISGVQYGLLAYLRANKLIFTKHMWPYLLLPGFFSVIIVIVLFFFGFISLWYIASLIVYFPGQLLPDWIFVGNETEWGSFFWSCATLLTWGTAFIMLWVIFVIIFFWIYRPLVLALLSPALTRLSEKTEGYIDADPSYIGTHKTTYSADILRELSIMFRCFGLEMFWTISFWIIGFIIPFIGNILSAILMVQTQAYYIAFGLVDLTLSRHLFSVSETVKFGWKHQGTLTGLGLGFILVMSIPFIGWFLAPTFGTVAATIVTLELLEKERRKIS